MYNFSIGAEIMENNSGEIFAELLNELAVSEGVSGSRLEQVKFHRAGKTSLRGPIVYEPGIVIVGQGKKIGYLGDKIFNYDSDHYLVVSVPLPFECSTITAGDRPYLAVFISLDLKVLAQLIDDIDQDRPVPDKIRGYYSTPVTDELREASVRLLKVLGDGQESRILGPQIIREITYHVLCGEQGDALRSLVARHTNISRISRTLLRIHEDYSSGLDIKSLSDDIGMSVSAFHHHFKEVTSSSPIQYIKRIRLHKARLFLSQDRMTVNEAAERVGYSSVPQFSREFKRCFGESPSKVI